MATELYTKALVYSKDHSTFMKRIFSECSLRYTHITNTRAATTNISVRNAPPTDNSRTRARGSKKGRTRGTANGAGRLGYIAGGQIIAHIFLVTIFFAVIKDVLKNMGRKFNILQ